MEQTLIKEVITTHEIIQRYGVTRDDLYLVRRKLELAGYIEPVRKGAQTYHIRKHPLPIDAESVHRKYLETCFTYTLPDDYYQIVLELVELSRQMLLNNKKNWAGQLKEDFDTVTYRLKEACSLLPEKILPDGYSLQVVCEPVWDEGLLQYKLSRQRRLDNIVKRLRCVLAAIEVECYTKSDYSGTCFYSAIADLHMCLNLLSTIKMPNMFEVEA